MGLAVLARKFGRLAGIPARRRWLLAEALLSLAIARIWLLVAPFRRVAAQLGELTSVDTPAPDAPRSGPEVAEIGWAVRRAADHAPFRAVCLQQAIAAKLMLRRRGVGSVLHLGVARGGPDGMQAHAWLDSGGVAVTGYPVEPHYVELARWGEPSR